MGRTPVEVIELQGLEPSRWADFLDEHSGLPGPRANLMLVAEVARLADRPMIDRLLEHGGEYQAMCAAAAAGRGANEPKSAALARSLAHEDRWRVREGVAIGLQQLGDSDIMALTTLVSDWLDDSDLLVQRTAVAALCEPRLLGAPSTAAAAVDACRRATEHLVSLPADVRRRPEARTLRQALGYCWSVAVSADPDRGLPVFLGLDQTDADVAWIVRENRRKKRLAVLLAE